MCLFFRLFLVLLLVFLNTSLRWNTPNYLYQIGLGIAVVFFIDIVLFICVYLIIVYCFFNLRTPLELRWQNIQKEYLVPRRMSVFLKILSPSIFVYVYVHWIQILFKHIFNKLYFLTLVQIHVIMSTEHRCVRVKPRD